MGLEALHFRHAPGWCHDPHLKFGGLLVHQALAYSLPAIRTCVYQQTALGLRDRHTPTPQEQNRGIYALEAALNPCWMIQGINIPVTLPLIWAALRYDPCCLESSSGGLSQSQPLWDLAYFYKLGFLLFLVQRPHHSLTRFFFKNTS